MIAAEGPLADYLDMNDKEHSVKLSLMFKPDFVEHEESDKPKEFWLREKGAYCIEYSKREQLKFSRSGSIADGVDIRATLSPNKDKLTISIRDDEHSIDVVLKKGNTGFGALEHMLDGSLPQGNSRVDLHADLQAHHEQKNKEMDVMAWKVVSRIDVNKCNAKTLPDVCPPCRAGEDCKDIKKCQVTLTDTKEPGDWRTPQIKLDARWRSCFNRTNTRKSNDFWISLISIKECESKDQSNCPRQMVDFSRMTISGGSPQGIPTDESPVVIIEGKNPIQGSSDSAYVKLTVTLQNDRLSIRLQLNKADKFQWLPSGKYNIFVCRFKIFGQMALVMLPKSSDKSAHKLVEHEITDNVRLPTSKAGYFADWVVKTRLSLEFPIRSPNGQVLKVKKVPTQNGRATYVDIEFAAHHFNGGIFEYGPINGKLTWRQLTQAQADSEELASGSVMDSSDFMNDNARQGGDSAACNLNSWFNMF